MTTSINPYEDAAAPATVPSEKLREIGGLALQLRLLDYSVADLEQKLKQAKEEARIVREEKLPEALASVGMTEFALTGGIRVTVEPFLHCSLAEGGGKVKERALAWLRAAGHTGLIKRNVTVEFKKGKEKDAERLKALLAAQHFAFVDREDVNTTSFKALVKELLEDGKPVPLDQVGVYAGRRAVITLPTKEPEE
jgi:hypothetical protein